MSFLWAPARRLTPFAVELFGQENVYGGAVLFDAKSLLEWQIDCHEFAQFSWLNDGEFRNERKLWLTSFPFCAMEGGDWLAIAKDGVSVLYLSHDGESRVIAKSLQQFLVPWRGIGFAGPESWMLGKFISPRSHLFIKPSESKC